MEKTEARPLGLTAEQKEQRKHGIGASEVAAILGLDENRPPLDVYCEKKGIIPPFEGNNLTEIGLELEEFAARKYAEKSGLLDAEEVALLNPRKTYAIDWKMATPDRLVVTSGDEIVRGLEAKTISVYQEKFWGKDGSQEIPEKFYCQIVWQMHVLDVDKWDVVVVFRNSAEIRVYHFIRNRETEEKLIERITDFKENILPIDNFVEAAKILVDWTEASKRTLARMFPAERTPLITADDEASELAVKLSEKKEILEAAGDDAREYENKLKAIIGEAAGLEGPWGRITWKKSKDREVIDWEAVARAIAEDLAIEQKGFEKYMKSHTDVKEGSRRFLTKFSR